MAPAPDESFKRPGSIPFKWEVQPGVPKKEEPASHDGRGATATTPASLPPTTPRLALPPAARASKLSSASCRRSSLSSPSSSHRRSMSARFATSLVLLPLSFTRRGRGGSKDDADDEFCLLYGDKIA